MSNTSDSSADSAAARRIAAWNALTPAEQEKTRFNATIQGKHARYKNNESYLYKKGGTGDVLSAPEIMGLILKHRGGGFTVSGRKAGAEIYVPEYDDGLAVAIQYTEMDLPQQALEDVTDELVLAAQDWQLEHESLLEEEGAMAGGYVNREKRIFEINISVVFYPEHADKARSLAEQGNQYSMWDFSIKGEIETGGTGVHPTPPAGW